MLLNTSNDVIRNSRKPWWYCKLSYGCSCGCAWELAVTKRIALTLHTSDTPLQLQSWRNINCKLSYLLRLLIRTDDDDKMRLFSCWNWRDDNIVEHSSDRLDSRHSSVAWCVIYFIAGDFGAVLYFSISKVLTFISLLVYCACNCKAQ